MITESFNDVVRRYKREYPYHVRIDHYDPKVHPRSGSESMPDNASWPGGGNARVFGFKTLEDRRAFVRRLTA